MFADIKGLNEECGIFGIWGHTDAAQITYYGLHSLQHRGQEGAGMVVKDGTKLTCHKNMGLVTEVFSEAKISELTGNAAIGHVRYSTAGGGGYENVQPLLFRSHTGSLAVAHNGNIVNADLIKRDLEKNGSIFHSTSDTEVLAHLIKNNTKDDFLVEQMKTALNVLEGAYALLVMTEKKMLVALDPKGFHPLSLGRLGDAYVIASESCAFDIIGATFERDIERGELLIISDAGVESQRFAPHEPHSFCSMEYVYFSRPDSIIDNVNVHAARKRMGKILAKESPVDADIVTAVPDSGVSAAIGFAEESNIPYEMGLIKNRYVGRTFIQPSQELRERGVKMKLSPVRGIVAGKRVVLIDDSIVRGTTSRHIVQMLRDVGASEVHLRVASPTIEHPCYYGIDFSTRKELIAARYSLAEICQEIGADSLEFLSQDGLIKAIGRENDSPNCGQCCACFDGVYPTPVYDKANEAKC